MPTNGIARWLRAARKRRGWSRETLAHYAGISGAAIAQIESGRRADPRVSSLVRLADALDVSVDELARGPATGRVPLQHSALLYTGADDFTTAAVAYLREGVAREERPLAVTSTARIAAVRRRLGSAAGGVTFAESGEWYSSPTAALNRYREYLNDQLASGARRVRLLGEPVWRGRTSAETRAWIRYEGLINIVFDGSPAILLCPYNTGSSPRSVVTAAQQTHRRLTKGRREETSTSYRDAEAILLEA